jgi:hypothetical protein
MLLIKRLILILCGGVLLAVAGWAGSRVYDLSSQRAEIKKDYSTLNNITYGLLSVNAWRDHLVKVVTNRIDDFEFSREQEKVLKAEVESVLHAVVDKADSLVSKKQKTIGGKLKKFAVKTFVKEDKIHAQVPAFAQTIVDEIKKPANKEKLKFLAQSKLKDFGTITYDSANDVKRLETILLKYNTGDVATFNTHAQQSLDDLAKETYPNMFVVLGIMGVFLLAWVLLRNQSSLYTPLFVLSVLLALIVLLVGLTSPMIEIDARIKEMSFILIGERISFHDQVIFFQSKSIVDVVVVLLETGKYDSAIVGILILIFSIVFPIGKLIATKLFLLGSERLRANKVIQFLAFKSGKWSMADVKVVAIFMAYIGFKGILDNQLSALNMKTDSLASISTNETSLQPGFILFVAFVLFGLILSAILQKIVVPKQQVQSDDQRPLHVNPSFAG